MKITADKLMHNHNESSGDGCWSEQRLVTSSSEGAQLEEHTSVLRAILQQDVNIRQGRGWESVL